MSTKTFTLDADFDITDYPYLLEKSDDIRLTKNEVLILDGVNDDMVCPDVMGVHPTEFTFALWGKANNTNGEYRLAGWADSVRTYFAIIRYNNTQANRVGFFVYDGSSIEVTTDSYITTNWLHIVGTAKENDFIKLYVNGTYIGQAAIGIFNGVVGDRRIGSGRTYGIHELPGYVDNVRIYNTVLDQTAITALYNASKIGGTDAPAGIRANWPFRGNPNDVSGNGFTGVLQDNACVGDDPDSGFAISSPTAKLWNSVDHNHSIDATADKTLSLSAFAATLNEPAGTSGKFREAHNDTNIWPGAGWSAWKTIAEMNTWLAGENADGTRYFFLEYQSNSDATATPDLDDATVTYTAAGAGCPRQMMYYARMRR